MHVLEAAYDLHILGVGHNCVRSLRERLQAAATKPIDRRPASFDGQPGHQTDGTGHIETLLALLLRIAEYDVFDGGRIDPAALDDRAHDSDGEIIGADISKDALFRVSPPDGRATSFNNNGGFHRLVFANGTTKDTKGTKRGNT